MTDTQTKQLMARIAQRDQHALTTLYEQHSTRVYRMAYQVTRQRDSAEEVTQDVFFQIWRWPERWDPNQGKFLSWVLTVTRYTAIDHVRRQQRRPVADAHDEMTSHVTSEQPDAAYHANARNEAVQKTLKKLPKEQRVVIMLAFFRGMTHHEIADHLDLSLGTVKSRMRLGMEKLRASLKEHTYDA